MLNSDLMSDPLEHCSQCLMDVNLAQYSFNKGLMILHSKNVGIEKSSTRDSQSSTRDAQSSTSAEWNRGSKVTGVERSTSGGLSISKTYVGMRSIQNFDQIWPISSFDSQTIEYCFYEGQYSMVCEFGSSPFFHLPLSIALHKSNTQWFVNLSSSPFFNIF